MIFHRFILGSMTTNCYIASDEDTKSAVLFDAPGEAEKIFKYINDNGLKLRYVILTHAHFDHIIALDEILKETGAELLLHEDEQECLNNPDVNMSVMAGVCVPQFKEYKTVTDGEVISVDSIDIKVIHTPGHTAGCTCYLMGNILVSGDTLFNRSIGRTDFPQGSYSDEINSIVNKLMVLDDEVKVYPGHGFSTTIGKERRENPYLI